MKDLGEAVVLDNGVIRITITKATGGVEQLIYLRKPEAGSLVDHAYWDWNGTGGYERFGRFGRYSYELIRHDNELVEVSFRREYDGRGLPIDVDVRYVLRSGDSGVYVFAIYRHKASYPPAEIGQTRQVWRLSRPVFDWMAVDDARQRVMPNAADLRGAVQLGPREVEQITHGRFKGQIIHKYDWSVIEGLSQVHGWASTEHNIGIWMVSASDEYLTGGPTKQNLSSHAVAIMLKMLHSGHYGSGGGLNLSEDWTKMYGPFMVYVNSGGDNKALWEGAKAKAEAEAKLWPYQWMRHQHYPLAGERGTVRGRLTVKDPQDPAASSGGAWVGLAAPEEQDINWQKQAKGYQFWARADRDGNFEIPNVRPGNYTMYAFVKGVMDEYRKDGIKVAAGGNIDMGEVVWAPKRYGKEIWQIGIADRTAAEFRHGEKWYQHGLPKLYPQDFPNEVNYVVGKSDWRKDWNYGHVHYQRDGEWVAPTWKINFEMAEETSGQAVLRFGIASARQASVRVSVNGHQVGW
ncbi:MAG TPA: polysaccharide lyase family protein, partial [Sedimentisphaerales bacterium]|nr:polysaccharide lyase family protein [Sedimentisphaerales bacterium]